MASAARRDAGTGTRGVWAWVALGALLALTLAACGAEEAATSVPATARAAATTAATNIPAGAVSTAGALATGIAPTVNAAASAPAASGPQLTVTGEVTKLDPAARTFTVKGTDGKDYDFTASANSQVDLTALAANLASKQQVTITYRGATPPYEVVSVR